VDGKPSITINDSALEDHHFLTEFSYQFLMITNDDDSAAIEISSNIPPEQKGYKVCYPAENPKRYRCVIEPN